MQHLGDYILQRCEAKPTTIIDIGAGDGLLMHYLQDYMIAKHGKTRSRRRNPEDVPFKLIATDDGSWGIFAKAKVEKLDVEQSLEKYGKTADDHQLLILCSWMPQMVDWTKRFREIGADEYVSKCLADSRNSVFHR